MVEPIMYFGIGFLVASLFGLALLPLVHGRAVRLTRRRLEAATPLSMAEIQADKDQLRAEFAMSTRRLEMSVEQLKTRTTAQLAELGKRSDAINRLRMDLGEKTATIFALETRERAVKEQLRSTEDELAAKTSALREAERGLAERQTELTQIMASLDEQTASEAGQRIEAVTLRTQVDTLREQVAGLEKEVADTAARLAEEQAAAEAATKDLADERGRVENLGRRIGELEQRLAEQTGAAETLTGRIGELENCVAEQGRLLAERERERDQLRLEVEAARRIEADLRGELAGIDRRRDSAGEMLRAEKAVLESQLERAREDRAKALQEMAALKREAESTWQAERVENALLRERINDVAAEVARLTAALEGPGSPIDAILAEDAATHTEANGAERPGDPRASLADRIRALQTRSSRLSPVAS